MVILKDKTQSKENEEIKFPMVVECAECGSELQITEDDLIVGAMGIHTFECPCCGNRENFDYEFGEEDIPLNKLKFPNHYFDFSQGKLSDKDKEKIDEIVRTSIEFLHLNPKEEYQYCSSGNYTVWVERNEYDDEYKVVVADSFYETFVPFEQSDEYFRNN